MRPDLIGSNEQAFGTGEDVMAYVIGGIQGKTVAAIGTCAPGSSVVQYLYAPRIHTDLGGKPDLIVGNASNKLGEFSCVYIPLDKLRMFAFVAQQAEMVGVMSYLHELEREVLATTAWQMVDDDPGRYVCALLPNFFIIYFGQNPPTGDITSDDVKLQFTALGTGYDTWCTGAVSAITESRDIAKVRAHLTQVDDDNAWIKHYCDNTWTGTKMTLGENGPCLPITMVDSDVYPMETADIKRECLEQSQPAPAFPSYSTLTIQHPGEVGQEAEAMKGAAKLMLLCLRGKVNIESASVTDVAFAAPAIGMQSVLDSPCSGRAVALSDLFRMTFTLVRDHDAHDIRSREMSMTHVSKAMASHLLLGNLTTNGITHAHNEANAVDPSAFLPQRNLSLVIEQQTKDLNARSELGMDVQDSHKTKVSTGIARIGAVTNMRDITSLCINVCAVISAITSDMAPKPIICAIMTVIYKITLTRDWDEWIVACGTQMPHLHLHIYSFVDRIWALLATGATEFNNTNVVTTKRPVADLNLTHHVKAIRVLKALIDQITLHQSQGTPITVQASITSKYSPFAATYPLFQAQPNPTAARPMETPNRRDAKRPNVTVTPEVVPTKTASPANTKKHKGAEPAGFDKKTMGMFYLLKPEATGGDAFPKDMVDKICLDWSCKGKECIRDPCPFRHPRNVKDMEKDAVIAIARNFAKMKKGWLSEYHFRHERSLPADVLTMMGNAQGPKKQ
jgi:hypothetical protein